MCPCAGIPDWIAWIKYISFVFYGFGLLLHYEYDGRTIYSCVNTAVSADAQMSAQVGGAGIPNPRMPPHGNSKTHVGGEHLADIVHVRGVLLTSGEP